MNWYQIKVAPLYAINDNGEIININTQKILTHNSTTVRDGKRRVTIYVKTLVNGKYKTTKQVYTIDELKQYIGNKECLIDINKNDPKIYLADVVLNKGESPKKYIVIINEYGVLCINKELFVISFDHTSEIEHIKIIKEYKSYESISNI